MNVVLPERPVQEPAQVVEMLLDTLLLQALVAEINDELVDAGLIEGLKRGFGTEALHVVGERMPDLQRRIGPAVGRAFLLDEFFQARVETNPLHLGRDGIRISLHLHRLLDVLLDLFLRRLLLQLQLPVGKVGLDLLQVCIYLLPGDTLLILIALRLHIVPIPMIRGNSVTDRRLQGDSLDGNLHSDRVLFRHLSGSLFKVYCDWHNQVFLIIYA